MNNPNEVVVSKGNPQMLSFRYGQVTVTVVDRSTVQIEAVGHDDFNRSSKLTVPLRNDGTVNFAVENLHIHLASDNEQGVKTFGISMKDGEFGYSVARVYKVEWSTVYNFGQQIA